MARRWRATLGIAAAWFGIGIAVAVVVGLLLEPRWLDWCDRFSTARCRPASWVEITGYSFFFMAFVAFIIFPIAASLWSVRKGGPWETTRAEPAFINLSILAALLYVGLGVITLAFLG